MIIVQAIHQRGTRLTSAFAVAAVHAAFGLILLLAQGAQQEPIKSNALKVFHTQNPSPPPPPEERTPSTEEGAQSPPPAAVLIPETAAPAPPPPEALVEAPPRLVSAPSPQLGNNTSALAGPGSGTENAGQGSGGGTGAGAGAGGQGTGTGSGDGPAVRTRRISGGFTTADYPRAARRANAEGTVVTRLTVGANGRVTGCEVRVSSGNMDLDRTTCGLIFQRFRFAPARDAQGNAVPDLVEWEQVWSAQKEAGPDAAAAQCRVQADNAAAGSDRRAVFRACMASLGWRLQ